MIWYVFLIDLNEPMSAFMFSPDIICDFFDVFQG